MPSWKKLVVSGSDATLNSLQVTTNVTAAAFSGSFSGSFEGDGSGLTGITSEVEVTKKSTFQFTSQNSLTLNHQLDSEYPFVQVYDTDKEILMPLTVESLGKNSIRIDFSENRSGFVIIAKGGYLVSDFTQEFTNVSTVTVSHSLNEDLPFVQVFGTDNQVFIPETVKVLDNNTVRVDFSNNSSGFVAISKGGYTIFDLINAGSIEEFTNQSSITLSCSSVSEFPFIQVYESGSNEQIVPLGITKVNNSTVVITFSEPYDGFISFPKTGHVIDNTSKLEGEPGSYYLDFNNFTNTPSFSSFPFTGSAIITGSLDVIGPLTATTFVGVVSSSAQIQLNQITGTTFDNANFTFPQDLTVQGKITAQEFYTELISSSIIYESGSTKFGDSFDDTHEFTGSVLITGSAVTINNYTLPVRDGELPFSVLMTDGLGNTEFELLSTVYKEVKNVSGGILTKGTPVHAVGTSGFASQVVLADAGQPTLMPATFILAQDLNDEEEGLGIIIGKIQGVDTTGFTAGDPVYVAVGGGFTQTKPTGSALIQNLGIVTKVGTNGGGVVLGAGRANDIPNIQPGYFWVGNEDSVGTPTPTGSLRTGSFTGSFTGDGSGLTNLPGGGDSFPYTGSAIISGSLEIQGSTFLSGTISASGDFVPTINELYNLGSPSLRWKDLYLSGSTIFLGNTKLTTTENGDIEVKDSQTDSLRKIRVDELELGTGESARKISIDPTGGIKFMDMQGRDKTREDLKINNVISSSQQILFAELPGMPSGLISSSNQINLTQTQNFITGIKSRLNVENVISGSSQITSSLDQRYVLSGSITQTTWDNIDSKPNGILSSSNQLNNSTLEGMTISGSFSGSFTGDGSGLSGIVIDIGEQTSLSYPFSNTSSILVPHNLNTQHPIVQVYNSDDEQILPELIKIVDSSTVQVTFPSNESGYIVVAKGGHVVEGTVENTLFLDGRSGSYYLDYNNLTNIPTVQLDEINGTIFGEGNYTFPGELTVQGRLTAQEFHTKLISSSVLYESGSTKFGDSADDIHSFTGSLQVLGTVSATTFSGLVSSSAQISYTELSNIPSGILSGSLNLTESIVTHLVTDSGGKFYVDGIVNPVLTFVPGVTYNFSLSNNVVNNHPFKFSTSPNGPTQYTTGVTSGSNFIRLEVNYDTPDQLYYYCTVHSGMGNGINIIKSDKLVNTGKSIAMAIIFGA